MVTATRSGAQKHETIFGRYFVDAFTGEGADTDKDQRVSVLEAFTYARIEVARFYEQANRMQTEHALLDDNGDGEGSLEPGPDAPDGALAAVMFLMGEAGTGAVAAAASPELIALYKEKQKLEEEIAALRGRKDQMESEAYDAEFERLLLDLARTNREIREREGTE